MSKRTVNAPLLGHPFRGLAAFGGYSILATVVCVVAALPSWADTNITSNVTLTEDTDWSDLGKVTIAAGVTVNLNGYNLTASDIAGSGTITNTMVDLTEPDSGGNHVWCTNTMYDTSVAANLFNNNFSRNASDNTRRLIMPTSSLPLEVDYDFLSPRVVDSYKLYCGPNARSRNPSAWALYGSNDKENWTELHSVSGENLSGDKSAVVTRSYTFDNSTAYRYYRFKGIACRDSSYFEMVQLEYFCRGVLHLNVPAGKTVTNSTVSLTGTLRLIKEGDGTFVAAKIGQTYSGGTVVAAGTLKPTDRGIKRPYGADNSQVEVKSGATLDVNGRGDFYNYRIVLDGGSIRNVGTDFNNGAQLANIRLESDSSIGATNSFGIIGSNYTATSLDLGGYTLTVNIASGKLFELVNTEVKNGTVDIASGGSLRTGISGIAKANNNNVATNADFRINAALLLYAPLSVRNYEALFEGNNGTGTGALTCYGTFKPSAHNYFYGPTMQDGSTIDLSARTRPLPSVSDSSDGDRALKFADGATVYIDLPAQKLPGGKVISWEAKPDNIGTVKFSNVAGQQKCAFVAKDDGLYTMRGFVIIVR